MPVVGHQAVGQKWNGHGLAGHREQRDKLFVVFVIAKELVTGVAAIHYVLHAV
jgi:hypothetical protein